MNRHLRNVLIFPIALLIRMPVGELLLGIVWMGEKADVMLDWWLRVIPGIERRG